MQIVSWPPLAWEEKGWCIGPKYLQRAVQVRQSQLKLSMQMGMPGCAAAAGDHSQSWSLNMVGPSYVKEK